MMCFDPISYDKAEKAMKHSKNVQEQLINAVEYNVINAIRNAELTEERDWAVAGCTYTASNGVATLTSTSSTDPTVRMRIVEKTPLTTAKKGDKFYLRVTATAKSDGLSEMYLYFRDWTTGGTYSKHFALNPTKDYVNHLSAIAEVDRDFVGEPVFYVAAATGGVAGLVLEITEPMMVNLTETFGAGNEPTIEEFESWIAESNGKVFFTKKHNLFNAKKIVRSLIKVVNNNNNFHISKIPKIVRGKKKLWTISYDDESSTIFNYAFPVHKVEDVPAIFYVIPSRIGTGRSYHYGIATTWDELREMRDWGFEIGNHTYSHNNTSYMDELTLIDNIKRSQEVFYLNGIYPVHFAYPGGASTMNNATVLQDYFLTAALASGGVNDYDLNPFRLKRRSADAYYNSFFNALDTLAASDGGWIITYHHAIHPDGVIEGNKCWTPTQLQTAIQYAKSLGIEVVSLTEGYETYAPLIYYFNEDVQPIYSVQRNGIIVNNPIP